MSGSEKGIESSNNDTPTETGTSMSSQQETGPGHRPVPTPSSSPHLLSFSVELAGGTGDQLLHYPMQTAHRCSVSDKVSCLAFSSYNYHTEESETMSVPPPTGAKQTPHRSRSALLPPPLPPHLSPPLSFLPSFLPFLSGGRKVGYGTRGGRNGARGVFR